MPTRIINGTEIYYEESGSGPETIVFSHGLLMSGEMFSEQVKAFSSHYRCVSYDHRGQCRSAVAESGYDMDTLTEDAAALIRELDCAPCHFAGLSMGGFVGMRLAIRHPELLRSLVLMDTTADPEPEQNKGPYRRMAFIGRWLSFRLVIKPLMKIMFGRSFLEDPAKSEVCSKWHQHLMGLNRKGTSLAAHGVIDRDGVYDQLGKINTPTLIIVGKEDVATPPAKSERMHKAIEGSVLRVLPRGGHSACIEEPEDVTRAMRDFFAQNL
ncbi:MAG: alpha/beta hydrolase [Xanthomonadales bacterium]|nr:alpha/beta hydrolase [Gammaproteobacteria bacterium]MBT8054396.1 alpha/beta hydrolase [Gammaproteobacteria bacterium]NND56440.1 alpha/beta hydrolase [Xanthomonadales bacterium]NNK51135.1 alpha/beta hydrolase [Xanthomonadales bacterium]